MNARGLGAGTGVAILLFVLAGCDDSGGDQDSSGLSPPDAVSAAGAHAMEEEAIQLDLHVESGAASYDASGPVELGTGRFRVEVANVTGTRLPNAVIGLDGEGSENTVQEGLGFARERSERPCWFNPHAPVGSTPRTASVEESVRLSGAIVESLVDEVHSVEQAGDMFEVEMEPSAAQPSDDFRETERRVWGDRALIEQLESPVRIGLSDQGDLETLALELHDYQPYGGLLHAESIDRVSITARWTATDAKPVIEPPSCQAIE